MLLITFYSLVCVYLDPTADMLRQKLAGQWTLRSKTEYLFELSIVQCSIIKCIPPIVVFIHLLVKISCVPILRVAWDKFYLHPVSSSQQCVGVKKEPGVPNYNTADSMQSSACTFDFNIGFVNLDASLNMYISIYTFMYTVVSHTPSNKIQTCVYF